MAPPSQILCRQDTDLAGAEGLGIRLAECCIGSQEDLGTHQSRHLDFTGQVEDFVGQVHYGGRTLDEFTPERVHLVVDG